MSTSTRRPDGMTPTVNLLSRWSLEALAARRLRKRFAVGGVLLTLLLVACWTAQELRVGRAEKVLGVAEAERASLTGETAALAPVRVYVAAVAKRKQTVTEAMKAEVRFSRVLAELAMSTPADADLTSIAVTMTSPASTTGEAAPLPTSGSTQPATPAATPAGPSSACPGPDPFGTRPVVGCLTVSGTAASREAIGELVVDLGRSPIFVEPFISTTTTADGPDVTFTGTVGLSPNAYTGRFKDLDKLLDERRKR